jgi:hypothetical protein
MNAGDPFEGRNDYLRRLPPEYYQGQASVHWSLTIQDRKTGWLVPIFYYKFREILTHTMFRYGLCCPIYCLMPDHFHLLWVGILDRSDQRAAMRYFRKQIHPALKKLDVELQQQPYDHVLKEDERDPQVFENVVEYISRNPERAGLVSMEGYRNYPYTGCLLPGYPELSLWQQDFWERLRRIYGYLRKQGMFAAEPEGSS